MAPSPFVRKLLGLPIFGLTMFVLFWSVPFTSLVGSLKFYQLHGYRNDNLGWATGMKRIMRTKILKVGTNELYRGKVMYLLNHRSWADLIVDQYATAGRAAFLSRWAVAFVFPAFMGSMIVLKSVLMFKRGHIADKMKFNNWIDTELEASSCTGLAVYPEGHRSTRRNPLPLKRGMLHYAFSRKLPVQIVIGYNKEAIISEKKLSARWGQTVAVGYSELIETGTYATFPDFFEKVQSSWDATWEEVFTCNLAELPELDPGAPDFTLAPFFQYMAPILTTTTNVIFVAITLGAWLIVRFFFSLLGPIAPVLVASLVVLTAVSIWLNSSPYDAVRAIERHDKKPRLGVEGQHAPKAA